MNKRTIGLIGCGNMGRALGEGILQSATLKRLYGLLVYDTSQENKERLVPHGAVAEESALLVAKKSDYLIIAVKPDQAEHLLEDIAPVLSRTKVIISIAAGVTVPQLSRAASGKSTVVRVMPNTLVAVGKGLFGICLDDPGLAQKDKDDIVALFEGIGQTFILPEKMFNAYAAFAGCGPAYVFYFAEAMVEAGVTMGLDRTSALRISLSLLQGSADLALLTGKHISVLREEVSSPGGMTIAATNYMDHMAVRSSLIEAMEVACQKGERMEQKK